MSDDQVAAFQPQAIPPRATLLKEYVGLINDLPVGSSISDARIIVEKAWQMGFRRPDELATLKSVLLARRGSLLGISASVIDNMLSDIKASDFNERRARQQNWQDLLQRTQQGVPISNAYNAGIAINGVFGDGVRYDSFTDKVYVRLDTGGEEKPLNDTLHYHILTSIQANGYPQAKKTDAADAAHALARRNTSNVLIDKLNSLTWDSTERAETWMQRYLGVEDTRYMRRVGRITLLQAVTRAFEPGCKADHTTVLVGKQGMRKSTLWRTLSYGHYCEFVSDFTNKDGLQQMRGRWFVELAELSAMNKKEVDQVKAFLTKQEDNYRKAYGREDQEYKREFVLCGSSNPLPFLKDYTGSRRWLCAEVLGINGAIDTQSLASDLDQLWAEAVAMYRHGLLSYCDEPWFKVAQDACNEKWTEQDPWEEYIDQYIWNDWEPPSATGSLPTIRQLKEQRDRLESASGILEKILQKPRSQFSQADRNRVGKILLKRGYEPKTVRIDGRPTMGYRLIG